MNGSGATALVLFVAIGLCGCSTGAPQTITPHSTSVLSEPSAAPAQEPTTAAREPTPLGEVVTYDELGDSNDDLGRSHVESEVQYPQAPPAGGDHNSTWLNCGIYEESVPNHHAVHSLEHGAVWLTYQPGIHEEDLDALRDLASQEFMILSPYEGQEHPIMATAWGRQLGVQSGHDTQLEQFIRDWRQGPQTPEPGAACSGGTSVDQL